MSKLWNPQREFSHARRRRDSGKILRMWGAYCVAQGDWRMIAHER
jgi:hypothetical protein